MERKIYNKVVLDMKTGEVLEEDSFLYDGSMALCADGDDWVPGADSGEGDEDDEVEEEDNEKVQAPAVDPNAIAEAINQNLQRGFETLAERLKEFIPAGKGEPEEGSDEPEIPDDLESLSRKDFLNVIASVIDKKLGTVKQSLQETEFETKKMQLAAELQQAVKDYPDFKEWREELAQFVRKNPGYNIRDAYILVRHQNPEKAKKLDEKYYRKEEPRKKNPLYTPMKPSAGSKGTKRSLTLDEAAEEAFNEIFGNVDTV